MLNSQSVIVLVGRVRKSVRPPHASLWSDSASAFLAARLEMVDTDPTAFGKGLLSPFDRCDHALDTKDESPWWKPNHIYL